MPSASASAYKDLIEGKLITSVTTSTTTGVTVKVKQINGVTPTWPTVAHRLKVIQRTATTNKAEVWQVAAGTTQVGTTVTLGTLTRALPLSDGTDFTGSGVAQSFSAGADVFLAWDAHDAAMTPKLDIVNTFTGSGALRSSSTTTAIVRFNNVTTAQRTGMTVANGDMVYDTDLNQLYKYEGGAWAAVATGTFSNAANGTAGKVDLATAAEVAAGTATDATSSAPNVIPVSIVKTSSSGAVNGTVPALNASVALDRTIGGLGTVTGGTAYTLIANGTTATGATQNLASAGTSGQVLKSNGASALPSFGDALSVSLDYRYFLSAGNLTTTSTSFGDMDATNFTRTVTCTANTILAIILQGCHQSNGANTNFYDISVGGTRLGGTSGITQQKFAGGSVIHNFSLVHFVKPGSGSIVVKPQWRVDAGTGTFISDSTSPATFAIIKIEP